MGTETGACLSSAVGRRRRAQPSTVSPDGRQVLHTSWDNVASLLDRESGELVMELDGHLGPVSWASFSPDGRRILTCSYDSTARLFDAATGECEQVFGGHGGPVCVAAFRPLCPGVGP